VSPLRHRHGQPPRELSMVPSRAVSGRPSPAFDSFREAVLAFAEEPTPANFVRYRRASVAFDGRVRSPGAAQGPRTVSAGGRSGRDRA
jgi:hypothetical protein